MCGALQSHLTCSRVNVFCCYKFIIFFASLDVYRFSSLFLTLHELLNLFVLCSIGTDIASQQQKLAKFRTNKFYTALTIIKCQAVHQSAVGAGKKTLSIFDLSMGNHTIWRTKQKQLSRRYDLNLMTPVLYCIIIQTRC